MTNIALRAEQARDLRTQLGAMEANDSEIVFQDTSPRRRVATLYSMENGEEINVLEYHLGEFMNKRMPDGSPRFTARQENAPVYREGTTKCFMAKDAPEREDVESLGIFKICPAEHLANSYAKTIHAEHKHRTEWRTYQDHLAAMERQSDRERQEAQTAAIMKLAESKGK